ncbi:MAG: hypothetical protein Q4C05_03875 [Akkermansia sp.]|nr:hypothetical protein [Akkermansia sp.]
MSKKRFGAESIQHDFTRYASFLPVTMGFFSFIAADVLVLRCFLGLVCSVDADLEMYCFYAEKK